MKISGFTFCRDAVRFDYPIVESIRSILPIVDEYIINIGKSDDGTEELIQAINDPKIKIINSVWGESLRKDGLIFSKQTNIALSHCKGDWAFYLQADEVVHEGDLPRIKDAMEQNFRDHNILGLMFRYLHFKGDYFSIDPWMYRKEIRIIRNNDIVFSSGDATGFALFKDNNEFNLKKESACWRDTRSKIFHYGWVKDPRTLVQKKRVQIGYHHGDKIPEHDRSFFKEETHTFEKYHILKEFRGRHPSIMADRVNRFPRLSKRKNRWLNPHFYKEVLCHGFKG